MTAPCLNSVDRHDLSAFGYRTDDAVLEKDERCRLRLEQGQRHEIAVWRRGSVQAQIDSIATAVEAGEVVQD